MKFRSKRSLDRQLRDNRPQPSDDLVQRVTADVSAAAPRHHRRARLVLAGVTTAVLALGLTMTGGMSYAASAVAKAPSAVKQLVKPEKNTVAKGGSGNQKVTICHIPPGNPSNAHLITISENAVPAHLAHGDPAPPLLCPPPGPADDQYKDKVLICHVPPGNPGNRHEISVSPSAVPAHLAHGDNVGPCV